MPDTMPRISFVVAIDKNRVIGANGRLPWRLPDDMRRFRELTMGKPVLMGRKTYESIPQRFRPLPGRHNIVLTRSRDYAAPGCTVVHTVEAGVAAATGAEELMVIGGASLYTALLPRADRLYLTLVEAEVEGDTHFPPIRPSAWREVARKAHPADERHAYPFTFVVLERRQSASESASDPDST